jgi:large subunit ribosomal protein L4
MAKAKLYNLAGEDKGEVNLNPEIFEIQVKAELLQQAVVAILNNRRANIAHTKDRSEVRGGGKKPWKQKGTGRARHGSSRSPIWKGGGVTFGPRSIVNFSKSLNKKMRTKALFMGLSEKAKSEEIAVFEDLGIKEIKTKSLAEVLKRAELVPGRVLLISEKLEDNLVLSARNIEKVDVIAADSLNVYDVMRAKKVVFSKEALNKLEQVFLKK